jgi:hypothetical protein
MEWIVARSEGLFCDRVEILIVVIFRRRNSLRKDTITQQTSPMIVKGFSIFTDKLPGPFFCMKNPCF